jgi:trans-aconitate 2-methyltransferase
MTGWNPTLYTRYEDERTRPAAELLARVPLAKAARVVDLGCGPGNSTELLARRFAGAQVSGIDNSEAMLSAARQRLPGVRFELGDIAAWQPESAPDLIYANAALQWVPGHGTLLPRLFSALAPGGVLALQMPDNRQQPSHTLMREVAALPPWQAALGDAAERARTDLLSVAGYYDLLAPLAAQVEVWHTIYQHVMDSAAAIVDWVRATGLRPYTELLSDELRASYLAEYLRRIDVAYPPRRDGRRLLAFPRLFIIARRAA